LSIPNNALSDVARTARLLTPDELRAIGTIDYERGGVALNDPSQGSQVANWRARLVGDDVMVGIEPYTTETLMFTEAGISEISLAFDQSMNPTIAYTAMGVAKLWWYDASVPGRVTTTFPSGCLSLFLTLDDKRQGQNATSDVLLFYMRASKLCFRQQRDRFATERVLRWIKGSAATIKRVGMSAGNRIQIELQGADSDEAPFPYLRGITQSAYQASSATIDVTLPGGITAASIVLVAVMSRSALTVPAGWTLLTSADCTNGAVALQRLSILRKTTPAPADVGVTVTFTQATADVMGAAVAVVAPTSGALTLAASATYTINSTATNVVSPPVATAVGNSELALTFGTTINTQASVTATQPPNGSFLWSGNAANSRLAAAYQLLVSAGDATSGSFIFDAGGPSTNGLAAITVRLTAA
jgi:hypothetical protein